ncbi:hypothetical protein [Litorimonas sp. WD9-15]|uniref:hypothetical protein n=1 Tax=Litorimonas sp. WD9-15 TaxID=3418716 RepID=UPI003CFF9D68
MTSSRLTTPQAQATLAFLDKFDFDSENPKTVHLAIFAKAALHLNPSLELKPTSALEEANTFATTVLSKDSRSLDLDPLILVEHQALLKKSGLNSEPLHKICERLSAEMAKQPESILQMPRIRHTTSRLQGLGYDVPCMPAAEDYMTALSQHERLISEPNERLIDLLDHITADGADLSPDTIDIFGLVTLAELRKYKIDFASKVVRALSHLSGSHERLTHITDFVSLQRSSNGSYGFHDPFAETSADEAARNREFHLPITLNAVWMLNLISQGTANGASL